jgi:hypothetical protein
MADFDNPVGSGAAAPDPIPLSPEPVAQNSSRRGLVIGGVVLAVIVVVAVGAALAYRNLVGEPFAAAGAIPSDADVVISFDLLQVRDTDRINRLVSAFAEPLAESGDVEPAEFDLLEEIDEELEAELGITLTDDVIPWIGRSVSIALWIPPDFDGDPEVLGSVAVRDRGAAEDFIELLVDQATVDSGGTVERSQIRGGNRWVITDEGETSFVIWLGDDVMLLAPNMRTINRALDARDGTSLLDESAFNEVVAELPSDRLVTMYFGPDFFQSITDLTAAFAAPGITTADVPALEAIGVGFTLRDDGIQFDVAQVHEDAQDAVSFDIPAAAISRLPADTIGYFAFAIPEGFLDEAIIEALRSADPLAFDSLSEQADELLGVDVFDSLIPAFAGDSLLAVVEERAGLIVEQAGVPLGIIGSLGVVDRPPVATALGSVEELIEEQGFTLAGESPIIVVADGNELLAYSLTDDALVVGSPPAVVVDYLGGEGGLTDSAIYRELDSALVGEGLSFYVDLERTLALVAEFEEDMPDLPLRGVGASGRTDGRVTRASLLILIDY